MARGWDGGPVRTGGVGVRFGPAPAWSVDRPVPPEPPGTCRPALSHLGPRWGRGRRGRFRSAASRSSAPAPALGVTDGAAAPPGGPVARRGRRRLVTTPTGGVAASAASVGND